MFVSHSAQIMALTRAVATTYESRFMLNPDHLATCFLEGRYRRMYLLFRAPLFRRMMFRIYESKAPGNFWYSIARVNFTDQCIERYIASGGRQIVLLGAGFDSRAYRSVDHRVRYIEVDKPATLKKKRQALRRHFGILPEHVIYRDADLRKANLSDVLAGTGLDPQKSTLFVAEGLATYLDAPTVDRMLQSVEPLIGEHGGLIFDYADSGTVGGTCDSYGAKKTTETVRLGGEPYNFEIPDHTLEDWLNDRGFRAELIAGTEELARRYIRDIGGREGGPIAGYLTMVHARKAKRTRS